MLSLENKTVFYFRGICVNTVQVLFNKIGQVVDKCVSYPHVVFATLGLGTNSPFLRSLSDYSTQTCALVAQEINGVVLVIIHTIHSPNNNYYKGD